MAKFDNAKAIVHLQNKWGGSRPCPMCGKGPWKVHDSTFQLTEYNEGSMVIGGPVMPFVAVICANCGNTVLVNAIIAEVVKPETPPSKEEPK